MDQTTFFKNLEPWWDFSMLFVNVRSNISWKFQLDTFIFRFAQISGQIPLPKGRDNQFK